MDRQPLPLTDSLPRLVFADRAGRLYDHPELHAVVASGGEARPALPGELRAFPPNLPSSSTAALPGRLPVGFDPETGRMEVVEKVRLDGKTLRPVAVAALFPPGWTRTLLPAYRTSAIAPVLPLYGYAAAGWSEEGLVGAGIQTDLRTHWDPALYNTSDLPARVEARLSEDPGNTILRQVARCALEYRCFTAQNTFYRRFEAAIPMSPSCNAQCVGCISEQDPSTGPPPSQWRIAAGPSVEECLRVAVPHLEEAENPIVSWGQGCEGEPLLRAEVLRDALKAIRRRTPRGTLHVNTNGSRPEALPVLKEAGLDSCRISLNAAEPVAYESYYRPTGYRWEDVARAVRSAKELGLFVSLNLLVFPGVSDRPEQAAALLDLIDSARPDMVQSRTLCIDPQSYLSALPPPRSAPVGIEHLLDEIRARRVQVGNYNLPREAWPAD